MQGERSVWLMSLILNLGLILTEEASQKEFYMNGVFKDR